MELKQSVGKVLIAGMLAFVVLSSGHTAEAALGDQVLKPGMKDWAVITLQSKLAQLGYYTGDLNGNFDESTRIALTDFQKDEGLADTGVADKQTFEAIEKEIDQNHTSPILKEGATGWQVIDLQAKLLELGYYDGEIDGKFGEETKAAVIAFQKDAGIAADGTVGKKALDILKQKLSKTTATYMVQKGDTLYGIAGKFGLTVEELMERNGITDPGKLKIGQVLYVTKMKVERKTEPQPSRSAKGDRSGYKVVETAKQYLGVPYVFGGRSPSGFDCSGFVQYVFEQNGIELSRMADEQYYNDGVAVDKDDLRPGDLVFFTTYLPGPSHVGIYIGNNEFIHASSGYGAVTITPLSKDYYAERYIGAKRVIR